MTRVELIEAFRYDNKDLDERVLPPDACYVHLKQADKEMCAITKCIQGEGTFNSVATTSVYDTKYDLTTLIDKFYCIDENPGGGVIYDDDPLDKATIAELDMLHSSWRSRSAGTPEKYYTRGNYLYFDRPVKTADLTVRVYCALVSNDFDDDALEPYNGLTYLRPFHMGLTKYLEWKGKLKIGKPQEAGQARKEFLDYGAWMKKEISGSKFGKIYLQPKAGYAK